MPLEAVPSVPELSWVLILISSQGDIPFPCPSFRVVINCLIASLFSCSSSLSKNTQNYSLELPWRGTRTSLPIKMKTKTEMVNINARVKRFNLFAFCIRTFHLSTYLPTFLPAYPKNPVVDVVAESSSFRSDDLAGRHGIIRAHSPRDVVNYKHRHKR